MTRPQRSASAPAARRSPDATAVAAPTHICCGQRLRQHDVEPKESQLSFTYCGRCESLRWFREDLPISGDATPPERTAAVNARPLGDRADASS
jgi:hypothetical protein